jgi:capsular exopolysaccharide synthesis family protein
MPNEDTVELRWILGVVRRWLWLIVVCTLLGGAVGYGASSWMSPVYNASVTLLVDRAQAGGGSDYNDIRASELLASTYGQMVTGRPVLGSAIEQLGLRESTAALAGKVRVQPVPETPLIRLSVKDSNPTRAALLANTIAEAFVAEVEALQTRRYDESLTSTRDRLGELTALIETAQGQVDAMRAKQIQAETDLAQQQSLLSEYRDELRALQRDYDDWRLSTARSAEAIRIVETDEYTALLASDQLMGTYSWLLTDQLVLGEAIEQLELAGSPAALAARITIEPVPNTRLTKIAVDADDQAEAAQIAKAVAEGFVVQVQALEDDSLADFWASIQTRMDDLAVSIEKIQTGIGRLVEERIQAETELLHREALLSDYRAEYEMLQTADEQLRLTLTQATDSLTVFETAEVPRNPVRPRRSMNIMLAGSAGALVAVGLAFLLSYLDDTIRTPDDVRRLLGQKPLAVVRRSVEDQDRTIGALQPLSSTGQAFRALANNMRFLDAEGALRTILVTSPSPVEGRSLVVANLAVTLARTELTIVVVDAEVHNPKLAQLFGVDRSGKLAQALQARSAAGRLQPVALDGVPEGLQVLTGGDTNPELLGSQRMEELLGQVVEQADMVLVDGSPVLPVADTLALGSLVDGVLLVLRAGTTRGRVAQQALENLSRVGAEMLGVVLMAAAGDETVYYEEYAEGVEASDQRNGDWWREPLAGLRRLIKPTPISNALAAPATTGLAVASGGTQPTNSTDGLSDDEIEALRCLHRETSDADVRSRCDMILWSNEGLTPQQVAERVGFSSRTVSRYIDRYETEGLSGLFNKSRAGRSRRVDAEHETEQLEGVVEEPRSAQSSSSTSNGESAGMAERASQRTGIAALAQRVRSFFRPNNGQLGRSLRTVSNDEDSALVEQEKSLT